MNRWMEAQFAEHKTESNSGLGKAISYLQPHLTKPTLFLRQPGARDKKHGRTLSEEGDSAS
jgi:transposase